MPGACRRVLPLLQLPEGASRPAAGGATRATRRLQRHKKQQRAAAKHLLHTLGIQVGRSCTLVDLAPVLAAVNPTAARRTPVSSVQPTPRSVPSAKAALQQAVLGCLATMSGSRAAREALPREQLCCQLMGSMVSGTACEMEEEQLAVLGYFALDVEHWHEQQATSDRLEDHALLWLRDHIAPWMRQSSREAWRSVLPLWRLAAKYVSKCSTRVMGAAAVDVLGELLLHTQRQLVESSAAGGATDLVQLQTSEQLLRVWSAALKDSHSLPLQNLFVQIFVDRDGLCTWAAQYCTKVFAAELDGASGVAAMRAAAVKHHLVRSALMVAAD